MMDELYAADFAIYSIYADIDLQGGLEKIKGYFGGKTGNFYTNQRNWRQGFRPWRALVDLRTMKIVLAEGMQGGRPKQYTMEKMIETCKSLPSSGRSSQLGARAKDSTMLATHKQESQGTQ